MKRTLPRFTRALAILSVIAVSLFPIACSTPATPPPITVTAPPITVTATPKPAGSPTIHIESPLPYTLIRTGDITMTVKVTKFNLVNKINGTAVQGEGHIDWYMDVDVPLTQGVPSIPKLGLHQDTVETTFTWKNVPIGTREFAVQLENNDNTPLGTPAVDSIVLNVLPPATGPAISGAMGFATADSQSPAVFSWDAATKDALIAVATRNVNITDVSAQTNPANVPGQAHFIYYIDIDPPIVGTIPITAGSSVVAYKNSYIWKNVSPGFHTFSVQLVNNDNTPLIPSVIYKVNVNLVAP